MTVFDPASYSPDRSLPAKIRRRMTLWRSVQPMPAPPKRAIISFTFDDFPKTAATYGADALDHIGAKGTYYTCTGMAGMTNILGDMFTTDDLDVLNAAGYEIAAHTHTHLDCGRTPNDAVQSDIQRNLDVLNALGQTDIDHFAWPYGETQISAKRDISRKVKTARGIMPGINRKGADMMQLRSYELTPDAWTAQRAAKAIDAVARTGGWLTVFTHDVRDTPSPFGVTPATLKSLARLARDSGAEVLTIGAAYDKIMAEAGA